MQDTLSPTREHLHKVDILRGIAILAVFAFHSQAALYPDYVVEAYRAGSLRVNSLRDFLLYFSPSAFGWSGVELFLLISGFLIHSGYLSNPERFNLSTFYSKRFWRIYPPYFLVLIVFCVTGAGLKFYLSTQSGILDFGLHALLAHNLLDRTFFTINTSFWSLALEAQLYLIYPIFLLLRKHLGIHRTFYLTLVVSLVLYIIGSFGMYLNGWNSYSYFVIKTWYMWAAGALLAECYMNEKKMFGNTALLWTVIFLLLLGAVKYFPATKHFQPYAATFMWLAFFDWFIHSKRITGTTVLSRTFIVIGLCSYSIYLIHQPLLKLLLSFMDLPSGDTGPLVYVPVVIACAVVFVIVFLISYAMYKFIELKSIAIGSKLRSKG